jgi:hypothetical protein
LNASDRLSKFIEPIAAQTPSMLSVFACIMAASYSQIRTPARNSSS